MLITITCELLSLFFIIVIFVSYLLRNKTTSSESSFFFRMIVITIIGLIVEIITTFTLAYRDIIPFINIFCNKLYLCIIVEIMVEITCFIVFLNNDSLTYESKKGAILRRTLGISLSIVMIIIIFLPIEFYSVFNGDRFGVYTDGPGVTFAISYGIVLFLFDVYSVFRYRNYYYKQRVLCLVFYFLLLTVGVLARLLVPGVTIIFAEITLICILIYFIIENYDMKKLETLKQIEAKATELNNEKTKFLFNMSHDIRTSLNTIVVTSNDLIESNVPEDIKTDLKDCLYASETLLEIVGNIIDLNKIEKDVITLNNVEYNLKKEVESLVDMTSIRIENKPINFIMNIDNSIPNVLFGDKVYVKQIINNLLTNAFKYTNEGTVKLDIVCENDFNKNECLLTISVSDTGIGIKDTSKLFNKFERFNIDKISSVEGTGLGLTITKKIIDSMNGTINVESTFGKGSKFQVKLKQQILDKANLSSKLNNIINYNFGNRRVLIFDDDRLNLKVEKKSLSKFNFKIDACSTSKEAIDLITNNGYDLIICDAYIENTFDDEVLKMAKKYNVPIVALTADAIEGAEKKYLSLGYSYYISKPYSINDIYNVLEKVFRK